MKTALFKDSSERKEFLRNPLGYNTLFAFASVQYQRLVTAPFGLPVVKSQGTTRHFRSAVQPNYGHPEMFGNFYVYEGAEAVAKRKDFFENINLEVF